MIITIPSKILDLSGKSFYRTYGASDITDAYLISQTVPTVIFPLLSGITTTSSNVQPDFRKEGNRSDRYNNLTNAILRLSNIIYNVVVWPY